MKIKPNHRPGFASRAWAREGLQWAEKQAGYQGKFLGQLGSYYVTVGETDSAVWYLTTAGLQFLQASDSTGHFKATSNKASTLMRANKLRGAVNDFLGI